MALLLLLNFFCDIKYSFTFGGGWILGTEEYGYGCMYIYIYIYTFFLFFVCLRNGLSSLPPISDR